MKQTFTPNHLLLAAYGELPSDTRQQVFARIECNEQIAEEFQAIVDMQEILDGFKMKPSQTSINIILQHSRNTAMEDAMA
jgi:hypothetical protein